MTPRVAKILDDFDRSGDAKIVARAHGVTSGYVYHLLREHRPKRKRKQIERTSELRFEILKYAKAGIERKRITQLFADRCSRQYVHQVTSQVN